MATVPAEPIRDIAHLGHVEMLTTNLDASVGYFHDVLGMEVSGEAPGSAYMRAFWDYEPASLKLTASEQAGLGHVAFRTMSPQALDRRVASLARSGTEGSWSKGDFGHGRSFQFLDPDGHQFEIYYDTERYAPPPELRPALKNQPQRFPARGVGVRELDHVNLLGLEPAENRVFLEEHLALRLTEQILLDDGSEAGVWLASNQKSYEIVYTRDATGTPGRFHHLAYLVDEREDVLRAADICLEYGVEMESGPHKHAIQQTFFLYTWEPGGNRVEICSGGYHILAPDHEPVIWSQAERAKGQAWGMQTVPSFHIRGTPSVPEEAELLAAHAGA
jgi:catechol 2,3-dioxygenase